LKHLRFVTYFAHGKCRRSQTLRVDSPRGRGAELSVVAIQQPQFRDERGFDLAVVKHATAQAKPKIRVLSMLVLHICVCDATIERLRVREAGPRTVATVRVATADALDGAQKCPRPPSVPKEEAAKTSASDDV
jgi:hypothetical protein